MRLGIFGGTFDPIHIGHLACAEMARDACGLDEVVFMVAPRPSLKQAQAVSDAQARCDMCRLAVANNSAFRVSTLEVERPGITYTVDTLRALRERYSPEVELCFIMGADSLSTLATWKDAADLARLATFICVARPGSTDMRPFADGARELGFHIEWVDAPLLDISSSEVRKRAAAGETVRYLLPEAVRSYIAAHALYGGGGR